MSEIEPNQQGLECENAEALVQALSALVMTVWARPPSTR